MIARNDTQAQRADRKRTIEEAFPDRQRPSAIRRDPKPARDAFDLVAALVRIVLAVYVRFDAVLWAPRSDDGRAHVRNFAGVVVMLAVVSLVVAHSLIR